MTDGSIVWAVLRLLVSLGVVLVLLVALARWASKRGIGSVRPGKATVDVDVLTRRSLGRNSTLQVVKVGSQVMVLGVTERGVTVLGELGDEDLVTAATPLAVVPSIGPSGPATATSFLSAALPAAIRRVLGAPAPAPQAATVTAIGPVAVVPASPAAAPVAGPAVDAVPATASPAPASPLASVPAATTAPFVWPDEAVTAGPVPPADPSPTWAIAESRAMVLAGFATTPVDTATQPLVETRAAAREARRAEQGAGRSRARRSAPRQALAVSGPRRSRTIVPADSRSARRDQQRTAQVPAGWPWNAAALVLSVGRGRRG